jgi:hemolysin activation/secretion protein
MDGTEMMGLGGANGVRAYPEGEGYGDEGYVLNIEARTQVPNPFAFMPGQLQLIGFFDHGSIIFNKNPWSPGINKQTLSGVGIGVNWFSENNSVLRMYLAQKVGAAVPTSASDQPYRFWVQFIQYL